MPYETMMYAGIASTAVFLVIAVVIFIQLDIRSVIGYLTGSTARKAIKEMESGAASGKTGSFVFGGGKGSGVNPGKTADIELLDDPKEKKRLRIFGKRRKDAIYMQKTGAESAETALLQQNDDTELLPADPDTATTVLRSDGIQDETTFLSANTALPDEPGQTQNYWGQPSQVYFQLVEHIVIVHTDETI